MIQPETLVYGGSFNPPTIAHQAVAEACLAAQPEADLWLMPSGDRTDKTQTIPLEDRLHMLELLKNAIGTDRLHVCTLEIEEIEPTETHRTVARLKAAHPGRQFRYVFGSDAYLNMPHWSGGRELQRELPMLVIPRGDTELLPADNVRILDLKDKLGGISSTQAREAAAVGRPVDMFVCAAVAKFITNRKLYQAESGMPALG